MRYLLIAAIVSVAFPDEPVNVLSEKSTSMRGDIEYDVAQVDVFPSRESVHVALRGVNDVFLRSSPGCDNWLEFLKIMKRVVQSQGASTNVHEKLSVETDIVERFTLYSFACEYDSDMIKANFDSRLKCIDLVCRFDLMQIDKKAVMLIADWLAGARKIIVDEETQFQNFQEAWRIDRLAIFGGKKPPRYPSSQRSHRENPPNVRLFGDRQRFQRVYNNRLPEFRSKAESRLRRFVFEEFKAKNKLEREALWAEFCRRAKFATND